MIQHLLKLIWKQRRQNAWIVAELFLVFILLWFMIDYFITLGYTSSVKSAYDIEDTYLIQLTTIPKNSLQYTTYEEGNDQTTDNFLSILERIRRHPQVENICVSNMSMPYSPSYRDKNWGRDTSKIKNCHLLEVTPSYFEVFRIQPSDGGTLVQMKESLNEKSIVISRKMAADFYPEEQAKGKAIFTSGNNEPVEYHIANVCGPLKRQDYDREEYATYMLLSNRQIAQMSEGTLAGLEISIRVKPGIKKRDFMQNFRQDMKDQLAVGNFVLYKIKAFEDLRTSYFLSYGVTDAIRYRVALLIFLLFNIFLGIIGTFWFRIEYRKPEIGLRIAIGSTRRNILLMMIGEGWLLVSLVAIPAIIICINLAKMELIGTELMEITSLRILSGLLLTYLFMAFVIMLGSWYPAYLSSRIAPADILRNE